MPLSNKKLKRMIADTLMESRYRKFLRENDNYDEKEPEGAEEKAPKGWWRYMERKISRGNPNYSKEQIAATIGDIWDNKMSATSRKKVKQKYGKGS